MTATTLLLNDTPLEIWRASDVEEAAPAVMNAHAFEPIVLKNNITLGRQDIQKAIDDYHELGERMAKREKIFHIAIIVIAVAVILLACAYITCASMGLKAASALGITMESVALVGIIWGKIHDCRPAQSKDCVYYEETLTNYLGHDPGVEYFCKQFARDYDKLEEMLNAFRDYRTIGVRTV